MSVVGREQIDLDFVELQRRELIARVAGVSIGLAVLAAIVICGVLLRGDGWIVGSVGAGSFVIAEEITAQIVRTNVGRIVITKPGQDSKS